MHFDRQEHFIFHLSKSNLKQMAYICIPYAEFFKRFLSLLQNQNSWKKLGYDIPFITKIKKHYPTKDVEGYKEGS